ncbi:molecular chaperone GrpE [Anaplasma marginale str. Dawn]|uniref:Protein GrpE n=3 Tax=Pseudomonadota TaxID=1224 RepID=B9KHE9_ANAMF|nr:nucleotide exchange factor GrpE [Anaplasma marginale]ACM48911.1 GrpE protein (grpE) [Anaplasma marginale str. Florida]AGZ78501.1 molecular chaperone GrpE [Anaplasma marginale str. Gypsy Plains]AGZ79358.1 molecular chaperone GrpE [Anaplasma marginale str. Dawn]AXW83701.1 nucleotide exchange factor GrpE [Anaplasma marginale]AXW84615.1 nucleotide exchange factor GrpE [Anaplasma marginale]
MAEERRVDPEQQGGATPAGPGAGAPQKGGPDPTAGRKQGPAGKFAAGVGGKAQHRVAADSLELEKLRAEVEHLRNQLRLAVADSKNLRRLVQKEVEEAKTLSISDFVRDLIASCDNLEASLKNLSDDDNVHTGVKMTWDGLMSTLSSHGVSRVSPLGEQFDPRFHKAVTQAVDDSKPAGTVLEVVQAGYIIQTKVLRPALVIVSKTSSEQG